METRHRESAKAMRAQLGSPALFRTALAAVPATDRDAWLDLVLGLDDIAGDDSASLPRGCVPYLPAPVDKLIELVEHAEVQPSDVFVDVGSGVGRATHLVHLATGAAAIGIEIQPALAQASRELAARIGAERVTTIEGDAVRAIDSIRAGTIFFFYCPFSGDRLQLLLEELASVAQTRSLRVCCLDLPLPECTWLELRSQPSQGLDVYRSNVKLL